MDDRKIIEHITELVREEQDLHHRHSEEPLHADEQRRLESLNVELDQCYDLLRQRRALRSAGRDPEEAEVRSPETVEKYLQ